jgi:hippurate hydrolase
LEKKPGAYIWIGNGDAGGAAMLHNPHYDFNDAILPLGASYWVRLTESALSKDGAAVGQP